MRLREQFYGVAVAVAQFWPDPIPVAAVLGVCIVCQFLEGYVLAPNLVDARFAIEAKPPFTTATK